MRRKEITFNGETRSVGEWERHLGISYSTIAQRLRLGWTLERALTSPATPLGHRKTHGQSGGGNRTNNYYIWTSMKSRCFTKSCHNYALYGGRGISVCERWMRFENFLEDMGPAPIGLSIDRIDNNGDYCKENCRWATPQQQASNRRSNKLISFDGMTLSISEWSRRIGVSKTAIRYRLLAGMPPDRIFDKNVRNTRSPNCSKS